MRRVECDRIVDQRPKGAQQHAEGRQTALETPRCADPEECPHPETKIAGAGVYKETLEYVRVSAHMHAAESPGFVKTGAGAFEQFAALAE